MLSASVLRGNSTFLDCSWAYLNSRCIGRLIQLNWVGLEGLRFRWLIIGLCLFCESRLLCVNHTLVMGTSCCFKTNCISNTKSLDASTLDSCTLSKTLNMNHNWDSFSSSLRQWYTRTERCIQAQWHQEKNVSEIWQEMFWFMTKIRVLSVLLGERKGVRTLASTHTQGANRWIVSTCYNSYSLGHLVFRIVHTLHSLVNQYIVGPHSYPVSCIMYSVFWCAVRLWVPIRIPYSVSCIPCTRVRLQAPIRILYSIFRIRYYV